MSPSSGTRKERATDREPPTDCVRALSPARPCVSRRLALCMCLCVSMCVCVCVCKCVFMHTCVHASFFCRFGRGSARVCLRARLSVRAVITKRQRMSFVLFLSAVSASPAGSCKCVGGCPAAASGLTMRQSDRRCVIWSVVSSPLFLYLFLSLVPSLFITAHTDTHTHTRIHIYIHTFPLHFHFLEPGRRTVSPFCPGNVLSLALLFLLRIHTHTHTHTTRTHTYNIHTYTHTHTTHTHSRHSRVL